MQPQDTTAAENWLPVVGHENLYEVSDQGRVRRRARPDRMLVGGWKGTGYRAVTLCDHGNCQTRTVHRLVAEAFLGPCPVGYLVNHRNGIRGDNRTANLEWVSSSANRHHAYATGLQSTKLTPVAVEAIRRARGTVSQRHLGQQFGIAHSTVYAIQMGYIWNGGSR